MPFTYRPDILQMSASVLSLEEWVRALALSEWSPGFQKPSGSPGVKNTVFQNYTSWGLVFSVQVPRAVAPSVGLLREDLWLSNNPGCRSPLGVWVLPRPYSCPTFHLMWLFLYSFSRGRPVLSSCPQRQLLPMGLYFWCADGMRWVSSGSS